MNQKRFEYLVKQLREKSFDTLIAKNAKYAPGDDCLHNFKAGAHIMGGTPAQTDWAYMTKHLVALRDKVERDDFSDKADLLEKCQDIINYIIFIWCIANEETSKGEVKNEI